MRSLTLMAIAGLGFLAGCGNGSSDGPGGAPSDVPRGDTIGQLNAAQQAELCDYLASVQGGYGRSQTCPGGDTQTTDPSQADCVTYAGDVSAFCPTLTVCQAEDCAAASGTNLCGFDTEAACAPVRGCLG